MMPFELINEKLPPCYLLMSPLFGLRFKDSLLYSELLFQMLGQDKSVLVEFSILGVCSIPSEA